MTNTLLTIMCKVVDILGTVTVPDVKIASCSQSEAGYLLQPALLAAI